MLKDKQVQVSIGTRSLSYYKEKGYLNCKVGDTLLVNVGELQDNSSVEYQRICDCCGKIYTKKHKCFVATFNNFGKDVCNECSRTDQEILQIIKSKTIETSLERYGVEFSQQLKEVKEKKAATFKKTCQEKYHVDNVAQIESVKNKIKQTNLEKYGCENPMQNSDVRNKFIQTMNKKYGSEFALGNEDLRNKAKNTTFEHYGVNNPFESSKIQDQIKNTMLEKYGVSNINLLEEIQEKKRKTFQERYGVNNPMQNDKIKEKVKATNIKKYGVPCVLQNSNIKEKIANTMLEIYGTTVPTQVAEIQEKIQKTCLEKYGVPYACSTPQCIQGMGGVSNPNRIFAQKLKDQNIEFQDEFPLENFRYDFKVGNILIEIDPFATHNNTWSPFNDIRPITYHQQKTEVATKHGYRCIHIFDWDDTDKVINLLKQRQRIYARNTVVKIITKEQGKEFLNSYHLQNYIKFDIGYGLFYNNELVSVMTWGKPRYNNKAQYELLRYASSKQVVGGVQKLFNAFIKEYNPEKIISYCDLSKFTGKIYDALGFTLSTNPIKPSKHWYNSKTHKHITDNLLRQRGFDQLLGKEYGCFGKGTSNEELMKQYNFVEIYDSGQASYFWESKENKAIDKNINKDIV